MDNILVNTAERKKEKRESIEKIYCGEKRLKNIIIISSFAITAINTTAALPTGVSRSMGWEAILIKK